MLNSSHLRIHHLVKVVARAPNHRREVGVVSGHEVGLMSVEMQGKVRPKRPGGSGKEKRARICQGARRGVKTGLVFFARSRRDKIASASAFQGG